MFGVVSVWKSKVLNPSLSESQKGGNIIGVAEAASKTWTLKVPLNCVILPQSSVNSIFNAYDPLSVLFKLFKVRLEVFETGEVVVPLSNVHSYVILFPRTVSGTIVLLSPTQNSKSWSLISWFVSESVIFIGNSSEDIKGGKPCVDFCPPKLIAFFVKITSAAAALGFSIASKK